MELAYLKVLSKLATKLKSKVSLEDLCGDVCRMICEIMRYPEIAVVRVTIGSILRMSPGFRSTQWGLVHEFKIDDLTSGRFEVYYTEEKKWAGGSPFLKKEVELLENIANLVSGAATKEAFKRLLSENTERLKELRGITRIIAILKEDKPIQMLLSEVCNELPAAWQYPEYTGARISYGDLVFSTPEFEETTWMQKQQFNVSEGLSGTIEVCYTKEFPLSAEGPFLHEERVLINNIAQLLSAAVGNRLYELLVCQNRERLKELNAINQTTQIITHGKSIADTLHNVCTILPQALQYPSYTVARITYEGKEYISSDDFEETPWILREQFVTIDNTIGTIEIYYTREFEVIDEGPFLKEERNLMKNIGRLLAHFLNNYKGRMLLEHAESLSYTNIADILSQKSAIHENDPPFSNTGQSTKALFIVREVLFVAAPYEAFAIQSECVSFRFGTSQGDTRRRSVPRFTVANTPEEALWHLSHKTFDLVIFMVGLDLTSALETYTQIMNVFPLLSVYILVNRLEHVPSILSKLSSTPSGNKLVFVWNCDPELIFAIIRLYEDTRNVVYSHASVVLLIEDSPAALSKIIIRLYHDIMNWVEHSRSSDLNHDISMQSYPHLLAVSNYDAATHLVQRYQDRICCVISDIEFDKSGHHDKNAGVDLVNVIHQQCCDTPCLLHSSDHSHRQEAIASGCVFIDKGEPDFVNRISAFVTDNLQKRLLTFRDESGQIIKQTNDLGTIIKLLDYLPVLPMVKNLHEGDFEKWFSWNGEMASARESAMVAQSAISGMTKVAHIKALFKESARKRLGGTTVSFENVYFFDRTIIPVLRKGSYGGKGRGVVFLNSIINSAEPGFSISGLKVCTPVTTIIGTDEFEHVVKHQSVQCLNLEKEEYGRIRQLFLNVPLTNEVREYLRKFVTQVRTPVAVRSSSLFEDSLVQPFAGAFETYIIPNNHHDLEVRLEQLEQAVKLVFASLYRPEARNYFKLAGRHLDEERMAVIVQELVGSYIDNHYYPHISGIAGSFNYYPVSHMKPEDGFAVIAYGLGVYVVEGRSGHRFSPAYPDLSFGSIKDALNGSQVKFFSVNLQQPEINLLREGEKAGLELVAIREVEKTGALKHCVSVYDPQNDCIVPHLNIPGPRIVDFADILKYNYIPLAESLSTLLKKLSDRMGTPIEIEFAVKLPDKTNGVSEPELYVLQVKPLVGEQLAHDIKNVVVDPESVLLYSENALGNGVIDTITDIIKVDLSVFDRTRTEEIGREVEWFNRKFLKENKSYILIGPGRWGTRDKSLGVPVAWPQISNARVIVELGLENYPLDASLGSHFFHNLTSMNTGYMAINENNSSEIIRWDTMANAAMVERLRFVQHYRFPTPLHVEIDGKKRIAIISWKDTA